MIRKNVWWYFPKAQNYFAVTSLYITLWFLFMGAVFAEQLIISRKASYKKIPTRFEPDFMDNLRKISLLIFCFAMIAELILALEKLIFMHGKNYVEYYTSFHTNMPLIIRGISGLVLPSLCVFLSTKPKKEIAFIPLLFYFISGLSMLVVGARGEIVLRALFILLYYFSRDHVFRNIGKIQKWLGKFEKAGIIVAFPIAILFLAMYNYMRENIVVKGKNVWFFLVDFIYKQGVSFDVLAIGYGAMKKLPNVIIKNYTFGPIVDEIMHGTISQTLFGFSGLGAGNNEIKAIYGNSFAHSMAYTVRFKEYLGGHGYGSSYILETFADFGWIGVVIVSFLLGALMINLYKWLRSDKWIVVTMSLMILSSVYFIPRAETVLPILFLITPHFWGTVAGCVILAKLACKKRSIYKLNKIVNDAT